MNRILKILIVIAIAAALAVGCYILFRSYFEQREFMEVAGEVGSQVTGFGENLVKDIQQNPAVTTIAGLSTGGGLTVAAGVALSKINDVKKKASDFKDAATSQIDQLKQEKDSVLTKADLAKQAYETQIIDLKNQLTQQKADVEAAAGLVATNATLQTELDKLRSDYKDVINQVPKPPPAVP